MVSRFDAVRLFIPVFALILWTLQPHFTLRLSARMLQCSFEGVRRSQRICTSPVLSQVGLYFLSMLLSYQVLRVSEQLCWESVCNVVFYKVLGNKCL